MPKRVPVEAKRVPLNCLVSPETKRLLAELGKRARSQGEIVDKAVAAWMQFRDATALMGEVVTAHSRPRKDAATTNVSLPPHQEGDSKRLTSWKRGPRPKGDKQR